MSDSSGVSTPTGAHSRQSSTSLDPIQTLVSGFEAITVVTPVPTTQPHVTPMNPTPHGVAVCGNKVNRGNKLDGGNKGIMCENENNFSDVMEPA